MPAHPIFPTRSKQVNSISILKYLRLREVGVAGHAPHRLDAGVDTRGGLLVVPRLQTHRAQVQKVPVVATSTNIGTAADRGMLMLKAYFFTGGIAS